MSAPRMWTLLVSIVLFGAVSPSFAAPGRFSECSGEIFESKTKQKIGFESLIAAVTNRQIIIFGERHETKEHAVAAGCVLSARSDQSEKSTLVMEMISRDATAQITEYTANNVENAAGLGVELKWWDSGWPAFSNWLPLVDAAFLARVPIIGGDLPSADKTPRSANKNDMKQLKQQFSDDLGKLTADWSTAMLRAHCGLIDDEQAKNLALHQIRRDMSIASSVKDALQAGGGALAYVGRSHARKDRSLYSILASSKSNSLASIGAFTRDETITEADWNVFDYIWVVGASKKSDLCEILDLGGRQ